MWYKDTDNYLSNLEYTDTKVKHKATPQITVQVTTLNIRWTSFYIFTSNIVDTSHVWLLSTWVVASESVKLYF